MVLLEVHPQQDIFVGGTVGSSKLIRSQSLAVDRDALQSQLGGPQGLGGIPAHAEGHACVVDVSGIIPVGHGLAVHIQDQAGALIGDRDVVPLIGEGAAQLGGIDLIPVSAVAHEGVDCGGAAAAAGGGTWQERIPGCRSPAYHVG